MPPAATLILRLAALAEAVIELRRAQQHAAQAAAARQAAEQLRAARQGYPAPARSARTRPRTAADQARLAFPAPLRAGFRQAASSPAGEPAGPRGPAPRPRGPTR